MPGAERKLVAKPRQLVHLVRHVLLADARHRPGVEIRGSGAWGSVGIFDIGRNFNPARSVYGVRADLAPHPEDGLDKVIRYLASPDAPNLNPAGLGSLLDGQHLLTETPAGRLRFEADANVGSVMLRVHDGRLLLPLSDLS